METKLVAGGHTQTHAHARPGAVNSTTEIYCLGSSIRGKAGQVGREKRGEQNPGMARQIKGDKR